MTASSASSRAQVSGTPRARRRSERGQSHVEDMREAGRRLPAGAAHAVARAGAGPVGRGRWSEA